MFSRLSVKLLLIFLPLVLASMLLVVLATAGPKVLATLWVWGMLGLAALATAAIALLVARNIESPVERMTRTAKAVLTGDLERRFRADGPQELVQLAGTLDELRQQLAAGREDLLEENQRLATILQSMTEGVIAVDDRQRVLLANDSSRRLLRLSTPEIVGRPLLEATRHRPLHDAVVQALRRPGPLTTEIEVGQGLASRRYLLLRVSQLPGEPCPGVVAVLHDVTELRRLENLRKEFVANVSHELKTPLASIKAYAETLKLGAINDPANNLTFVGRIEEDANRLHQLITDMLQIARIESHQQAFNVRQVIVDEVVARCAEQMAPRAAAKQIELRIHAPPEPVIVVADEDGVHTILANLVDNSIKYTPPAGRVAVRWSANGEMAILQVEDTGIGIAPENQSRIFERFYRVDLARSRDAGGTGLGLSIVKHLVQAFDGSVSVSSEPGQGSTFEVRLPLPAKELN
jgi:two-component system phosphate regulon sensor histidine kinase PhoR